jgi:hypothetical protein
MNVLLYIVSGTSVLAAVSHYNVHQFECFTTAGFLLASAISVLGGFALQKLNKAII